MIDIVKDLILPSNVVVLCSILGALLLLVKKANRVAFSLLVTAVILYLFFGNGPVSFWLLGNLEDQYPPLNSINTSKTATTIVILAGYAKIDSERPISSEVNSASAFRVIEALRVFKAIPKAEILISGSCAAPQVMRKLLVSLGAPSDKVTIEQRSANTYQSAVNLEKTLRERPFILVTSAGHMPRAMGVFLKLGMNPIPAPTDYQSFKDVKPIAYLPSPLHLKRSDQAVYEYLGILWYQLRGRL
jgi:uncharacterized SAM-binding protein YcdF (DUF218 family)